VSAGAARLAALLRAARRAVALTGAGISVPSGIPDFRTPLTGMWANVDPMEVAHIDVFTRAPERFWGFYGPRFALLRDKRPNGAHHALAELERRGLLAAVITQNIDGLHRQAGTPDPIEVHGSLAIASCPACGVREPREEVARRVEAAGDGVPRCGCGAALKPGVVLFGELLPEAALERAFRLAGEADLLVCVGSSLEVHPVAGLPGVTLAAGGRVALVTQGPTPYDADAAVKLDGDVEHELEAVMAALEPQGV